MSDRTVSVGLRIDGDSKGAVAAVDSTEKKLRELGIESAKVQLLEGAVESVDRFKIAVTAAQAKVSSLQSTLSEAYASGADAPLLRNLERDLGAAERAAVNAEKSLKSAQTTVVGLNLKFAEAGITTSNLADKKAALAAESDRLAAAIKKEAEYQAYLRNELERVAAAEKAAADAARFEAQRQAALSYQKAAEYASWWATELDKVEKAERAVAARADLVNTSLSSLGVRSAKQIEADLLKVNQTLQALASNSKTSGADFDRAFAAGQARIKQLRAELNGASGDVEHIARKADNMLGLMGSLGVAFSGAALAREFLRVNVELENTERTFRAVTGSVAAASQEMEYARDVANRLGLEQIATAKSYADLLAATKGTAAEGAPTRAVFESVSRAMSVAGKSAAETSGALNALSQMASKGVVQMEELRGQLGDRLPGALKATADGLGISTAQLIKLVESGRMTAEELFPALAAGLDKLYGSTGAAAEQTETLTQKWEHFKNGVTDAFKAIGDAGAVNAMKYALEGLETVVVTTSVMVVALGKDIGIFLASLANGDIGLKGFSQRARDAFAEVENEARDKLVKTAAHNRVMAATLDDTGQKALAAAKAQAQAAAEAAQAGAAAATASNGWTKLNVVFGELEETTEKATKQAVANVEARKAEGAAAVELANAFGTEVQKRQAKIEATQRDAEATQQLAERRREELATYKGHLEALQKEVDAKGKATDAQQKVIDELKKTIEARQADADKAAGQARSSAVAAAAAQSESAAYADNSARLGELKAAYEQASAAVDTLRAKKAAGANVTAELAAAELKAGQAAALYRDALADQVVAIQANASAKQSAISIDQAGIRLEIARQQSIHDVAKAMGDEQAAAGALVQIKQMEIQLAVLTAQAKRAEGIAALEVVKAKRAELEASGQLTPAKIAELKAQEAAAQVKQVEADIADVTAERMRQLAGVTSDSAAGAERASGSYDKLADSLKGVESAANGASNGLSSVGVRNASGSSLGKVGGQSQADFTETLYRRGGSIEEVKLAQKYVAELYARNQATMLTGNLGNEVNASRMMQRAINDAVDKALAAARQEKATGKAVDLGTSVSDIEARNLSKTPLRSLDDMISRIKNAGVEAKAQPSVRVDLRTDRGRKSINVGSHADANNLVDTLKELQSRAS